jgi:hypothetical protein
MSALSIQVPFPVFQDRDGQPLENGYVWIGVANLNPQTNPVVAYYDAALTIPAAQPLRTLNGYISRAGSPAQVYVDGVSFSILVQDSKGSMVYNFPDGTGISPNAAGIVYDPAGTGAVATTAQAKLRESVSLFDFMTNAQIADVQAGTKLLDVSAAVQAAITACEGKKSVFKLQQPAGMYRCDSPLYITKPLRLEGDGVSPHMVPNDGTPTGSIFFFNHTGRGITIQAAGGAALGKVQLDHMGTMRPQPAPAPGWTPTAHDFDIYAEAARVEINDFTLVNATKGIEFFSVGYGGLTINDIKGQPMQVGIQVTASADVVRVNGAHFWPFWKNDNDVDGYTKLNLNAFLLYRCDNPNFSNIFTIYARSGITFAQNAYGCTAKMHMVNADFDLGLYGINVDASVTSGVTGQFENITIQGDAVIAGTTNITINGNNSILQFGNLYTNTAKNNSLRITGSNNRVSIGNYRAAEWNLSSSGFPAIEANNGNFVKLATVPTMYSSAGGDYFSSTGSIQSPLGYGQSTASTNASGDIVVAHGLGINPRFVFCQLQSSSPLVLSTSFFSPTNFTVRVTNSMTGAPLASTPVDFTWFAIY